MTYVGESAVSVAEVMTVSGKRRTKVRALVMVNSTNDPSGLTINYAQYAPLSLPYTMVLSLEEA